MKPVKYIAISAALLLAVSALTARADDPKPAIIGRASISSVDDAKKLVTDLGLPLPADPTKMIEGSFPSIGPGGLQTDKPVGVLIVAGENVPQKDLSVMALPVVAGKATVATMNQAGGQAVPDHPDMSAMGGFNFRRTNDYLMFYTGALDILASVNDDPFTKDYTRPGRVALVSFDLDAFRAAAPTQYKAYLESLKHGPSLTGGSDAAAQQAGVDAVQSFVNSLNHVSLALSRDEKNLHIETWMRPFDFKGSRKFPRPTFPADIVAQMHIVYPTAESTKWLANFLEKMPADSIKAAPNATPDQNARGKALAIRAANLLCGADAESIAVSIKAGKPIIYLVNQYTDDRDFGGEVKAILADGDQLDKDTGQTDSPTVSTYQSAAGKPVTRISVTDKGKQQGYVDFIQNGHVVSVTIASDDGKYLDNVAALPTNGEISNLCSGSVDLGAVLKASQDAGQGPPMPPEQLKEIAAAFNGQSITWDFKTIEQTKDVYVDLGIPIPVLKEVGKIVTGMMANMFGGPGPGGGPGGPGGPPPAEPGPPPAPAPMPNQ